jgi:hypothetical protein
MLNAIAGLSALAAGMLTPVSLRRPNAVAEAKSAPQTVRQGQDSLELTPGHMHEVGQYCPVCGREITVIDEQSSGAIGSRQRAPTGKEQGVLAEVRAQLDPANDEQLSKLKKRDQEVRAHEQAHKTAGGQFAGSTTFSYQMGPDGQEYAVGGEVSVDISPVPGDPQATIAKMQQIRQAAVAPAQPSSQDQQVAAEASRIEAEARAEQAGKKGDKTNATSWNDQTWSVGRADKSTPQSPYTAETAGESRFVGTLVDIAI